MNNITETPKREKMQPDENELCRRLKDKVAGQNEALDAIASYVQLFEAGLSPEGRPVGVFLLLGPTGTGKTRTVEALAEALHGSDKHLVRIDCGEFQLEHEVAKLIGAPPGYLGHRETHPLLTQTKLNAATSDRSPLSLVLFDEIEKAAPSMQRLLLGVLDKAQLRLGDNTVVNFERSIIFLTSNLGSQTMMKQLAPSFGLAHAVVSDANENTKAGTPQAKKLDRIAASAIRRHFAPEFLNRIDQTVTYYPLDSRDLERILDQQLASVQRHILQRLGNRAFLLDFDRESRRLLLRQGTSLEFGARELKRTIHRQLIQPLAGLIASSRIAPGMVVRVTRRGDILAFAKGR